MKYVRELININIKFCCNALVLKKTLLKPLTVTIFRPCLGKEECNVLNYSTEYTRTGLSADGILFYISKRLPYQLRNDLRVYDPGTIKSTFIEIIN